MQAILVSTNVFKKSNFRFEQKLLLGYNKAIFIIILITYLLFRLRY